MQEKPAVVFPADTLFPAISGSAQGFFPAGMWDMVHAVLRMGGVMEFSKEELAEARRQIESTLHKLRETADTLREKGLPDEELLAGLQAELQEKREIAVTVKALAPSAKTVDVAVAVTPKEGTDREAALESARRAIADFFGGRLGEALVQHPVRLDFQGLEFRRCRPQAHCQVTARLRCEARPPPDVR